ncbi:hypothetical protein ACFQ0G_53710 [Streptomyces chiangmaiensis]
MSHTKSRHSGPARWLRAVRWLIGAGLHNRANATTQRIADDLAARMDYTTGHVLYRMQETAVRVGIDVANVKRHVSYLRELGALAWVQRGSRANIRRTRGLDGYAGTATVYAAVIPPVFDHAMGHRIVGAGYVARIVIDQRGQQSKPVDNSPGGAVDNSGKGSCAPPSLTVVKKEDPVQVVGGVTTTATRQRNNSTPRNSSSKRATILGTTVTAAGMQLGDKLARAIRRRVSWVRKASHDQLRWVCADMGEQQWTEDQAVRFVVEAGFTHRAGFAWEPTRPHRLIAAELRAHQEQKEKDRQDQEARAQAVAWEDSTAYRKLASSPPCSVQPPPSPSRSARTKTGSGPACTAGTSGRKSPPTTPKTRTTPWTCTTSACASTRLPRPLVTTPVPSDRAPNHIQHCRTML